MAKKVSTKLKSISANKAKTVELIAQKQINILELKRKYDDSVIELTHMAEDIIDKTRMKLQEELKKEKSAYESALAKLEEDYS
jgi:F0F1-type ATP synthase membrane subunit b/b'